MEIEKEIRYAVKRNQIKTILDNTVPFIQKQEMLDITCGYHGFDSYSKSGFICRVRQKNKKKTLEVKKYFNNNECIEQSIELNKIADGVNYLKLIGMMPYLYLKRFREVRKFKNLKIFIDEFDILGYYIEIEYQDSDNAKEEIKEFIKLVNINNNMEDMYGDIVKNKLKTDLKFKKIFDEKLEEILK